MSRKSIEKEPAADVGSLGAIVDVGSARPTADGCSTGPATDVGSAGPAVDVGSAGPAVDVGSLEVVVAEEKLSEKKQKRIKLVGTKGKGKKVEKGLKEKQKIKLEETKYSNEGEDLKSHVYKTIHSRMSPSSIVKVIEKYSEPFCITEEHVHQVLGLPMGGIEIEKNNFSRDKRVIQQWKKQFKSNSLSIKIGELKEFLKEHNSAGLMFKRNFVVLCVSTLMDESVTAATTRISYCTNKKLIQSRVNAT
uniref:Uncharacterized protein n=1 Tax=Chenopodium quinoa TaxID=63459 RepID=A0A803N776_CHEQI